MLESAHAQKEEEKHQQNFILTENHKYIAMVGKML